MQVVERRYAHSRSLQPTAVRRDRFTPLRWAGDGRTSATGGLSSGLIRDELNGTGEAFLTSLRFNRRISLVGALNVRLPRPRLHRPDYR